MKIGSLFSGIGGLELGLEWAGLGGVVWQVESDEWCRRVLERHWPDAVRFNDVRTADVFTVDVMCGGFPCQDVSGARTRGPRPGLDGERSGLWRSYAGIVERLRPRGVIVENVASGKERWLCRVRADLRDLGYQTEALGIDASDVGAPHGRARIFVVAYANGQTQSARTEHAKVASMRPDAVPLRHWGQSEPGALRVANGISTRLDGRRLKALGNAAVPHCAYVAGLRLSELMTKG